MESVKPTGLHTLTLPAELTHSTDSEFYGQVQSALGSSAKELIIDCSQIVNATSSHIGILWKVYDVCKSNNIKLRLEQASTGLVRVLIILDLGELFGLDTQNPDLKSIAKQDVTTEADSQNHSELICVSREKLGQSIDAFLKFTKKCDVPEIIEFEMRTVLYEVITNVIDHSGLTENDNVKFTANINGTHMKMVFEDLGAAFDPTVYNGSADLAELVTAAKERRFKGFGLLMIRKLVNKIHYSRKEDIMNHLEIDKHWS